MTQQLSGGGRFAIMSSLGWHRIERKQRYTFKREEGRNDLKCSKNKSTTNISVSTNDRAAEAIVALVRRDEADGMLQRTSKANSTAPRARMLTWREALVDSI
jgi:hypothetical protein